MTNIELEKIMYAFRDQARLYRRLRRDVQNGVIDHYTVEECTEMIKEANANAKRYELMIDEDALDLEWEALDEG